MNYFRTNFCDRIVCLVTSFSLSQFCLPFLPDCCTKCRFTEFFFFCFPISCHACSFFLPLTLFLNSFLSISYHIFSVPSLSRLNIFFLFGIYFRTSFLQPTLEERKNIHFSLLSSVSGEKRVHHNIVLNLYKVPEEAVHLVTRDWFQLNSMLIYIDKYL